MSQICGFCGCPLDEGCGICPNCGAPVSGGEGEDISPYGDPTMEAVSAEEYTAATAATATPESVIPSTPASAPTPAPAPKAPAKPVSVPKVSDYDHMVGSYVASSKKTTASPSGAASAGSRTSTPAPPPKPKKKRGCCGCGCCLPVLIVMALSVFLIFSGVAGALFDELGIPVDLSGIEQLLHELTDDLPMELPGSDPRDNGSVPADAVEFNGHYYRICTEPVDSYEDAMAYCESMGGYLATISSAEENQFLYEYMLTTGVTEYAYLGGSDGGEEGIWIWCTGEPFAYTNWSDGEPNNDLDGEQEMAMHRLLEGGMWNDIAFKTPSAASVYAEFAQIEASSILNGKNKYGPASLQDGDLNTAWNEGASGITGESVTYYYEYETTLTGFEIWGGFQYSEEIYYANARPATVELAFSDGTVLTLTLEDVREMQRVVFDAPVATEWVTMTVLESYEGTAYEDLCISELYYLTGSVPVNCFICEWGDIAE